MWLIIISRVSSKSRLAIISFGWIFAVFCLPVISATAGTRTAASPNFIDVNAAVAVAGRGDTVQVPAGSSNWGTNTLTLAKEVFLKGAGRDSTFITSTSTLYANPCIFIQPDPTAIANGGQFRIEGFTFDGSDAAGTRNLIQGDTKYGIKVVIGWNRFRNNGAGTTAVYLRGQARGVIYKNLFDRCDEILRAFGYDQLSEWTDGYYPLAFGSADNLYFEDNHIAWSSALASGNAPGWCETGQGGRVVYRYNTWDFANQAQTHYEVLDFHGFQGWNIPPGHIAETGTMVAEAYGNTVLNSICNRFIMHRGSWGMFFNNVITGEGLNGIYAQQYGASDAGGSGCQADVEAGNASASTIKTQINNTYVFNNTVNGMIKNMTPGAVYGCGIAENSEYFNYNASFDGTSGIGRGTTIPTMSATNGTAYWVASTPTPTVSPDAIQNGTLYKRAGGAWTPYYKPYTYPHPLARPGGLNSPTSLRIVTAP